MERAGTEVDGNCAMSAAMGNKLATRCSVVRISLQTDKLCCFSSESTKAVFLADPQANERDVQALWADPSFWEDRRKARSDDG